jgi:serine/threonine protein kinase
MSVSRSSSSKDHNNVVGDHYQIIQKIGCGSFGEIYSGTRMVNSNWINIFWFYVAFVGSLVELILVFFVECPDWVDPAVDSFTSFLCPLLSH